MTRPRSQSASLMSSGPMTLIFLSRIRFRRVPWMSCLKLVLPAHLGSRPVGQLGRFATSKILLPDSCLDGTSTDNARALSLDLGGPQETFSFFQIASGPILSIPFHLKVCQYGPCKVSLKKMTPSLPTTPQSQCFFGISDWTSD